MKKISLAFVGIALLVGAVPGHADNKEIQVVAVVGTAKAGGRNLRAGDHIRLNEVIETDENSGCKIRLGDRTVIDIAASSVFRVEAVKGSTKDETITRLDGGAAKASVPSNSAVKASVVKSLNQKPKFYMKTKWSVIAVRGTTFFAHALTVGVTSGSVDLLSPDMSRVLKSLPAGRILRATDPSRPDLWQMSPLPVQIMQQTFKETEDSGALFESASAQPGEGAVVPNRVIASTVVFNNGNFVGAAVLGASTSNPAPNSPVGPAANAAIISVSLDDGTRRR